jgi:hypothetical protein
MAGFDVASMLTGSAPQLSGAQRAGRALSGLSAGLMGKGAEYLTLMQAQDEATAKQSQQLSEQRLKAMALDAQRVNQLLQGGDIQGALRVVDNRTAAIKQLGGDPSDTLRIRQLITAGEIPAAQAEIGGFLNAAQQYGLIEAPKQPEPIPSSAINQSGQVAMMEPDGRLTTQTIPGYTTPQQEQFEIIPPELAAQLGLPSDKQFQRNKVSQQISQIGSGPAVTVNTGQATEAERTAGILANRLDFAQSQINDILSATPETASPGALPTVFASIGLDYLARISNPAERQIIEAAQDDMLDAALTLGTGAAYTQEQFQAYKRSYFPQLGDDKKTIDAKARRLTNLLDAAYKKAGRGAPEQRRSAPVGQPAVGEVMEGYKFMGGNPADPTSWEKQ